MHRKSFLALAAFAALFGTGVGQSFSKTLKLATDGIELRYDLVAEFHRDRFVIDHDLSLGDCLELAPRNDVAHSFYTACERTAS